MSTHDKLDPGLRPCGCTLDEEGRQVDECSHHLGEKLKRAEQAAAHYDKLLAHNQEGVALSAERAHVHRCMSCGESWFCPHPPADCKAGENAFPSLTLRGPNGPHGVPSRLSGEKMKIEGEVGDLISRLMVYSTQPGPAEHRSAMAMAAEKLSLLSSARPHNVTFEEWLSYQQYIEDHSMWRQGVARAKFYTDFTVRAAWEAGASSVASASEPTKTSEQLEAERVNCLKWERDGLWYRDLIVLDVLDELEALRRGVAITYPTPADDPVLKLRRETQRRERLLDRIAMIDAELAKVSATEGRSA